MTKNCSKITFQRIENAQEPHIKLSSDNRNSENGKAPISRSRLYVKKKNNFIKTNIFTKKNSFLVERKNEENSILSRALWRFCVYFSLRFL